MLLPLAQKMTKKFIDEDKLEAEAEVELYLMILEKQEKYEEMLKVMNGPLGLLIPSHLDFFARRKVFLYLKMSLYHEAFEGFKSLIKNNIDQLEYYLEFYKVAFILDAEQADKSDCSESEHLYINKVIEANEKIFATLENGGTLENESTKPNSARGPYLARIELLEILKDKASTQPSYQPLVERIGSSFVDLLIQYFKTFGHKSACFFDMSYIFSKYQIPKPEICSVSVSII